MLVKDVAALLEILAPLENAEDFDNVGLLAGKPGMEVSGILICLDALEEVVEEAHAKNCNLILSFHPIIFKPLKTLRGETYVERAVMKAISCNIAIYALHTALDNAPGGVSARLCEVLGLTDTRILLPKQGQLRKLSTYVPSAEAEGVRMALFEAGAGQIGPYSHCSFSVPGTGSFKAGAGAHPVKGKPGQLHYEKEEQLNLIFPSRLEKAVLKALFEAHPYEQVAYEVFALENKDQSTGMGCIGLLPEPMEERKFLEHVKKRLQIPSIRHSRFPGRAIQKVAVLGGSGAFGLGAARAAGAHAFLTADIRYHEFFEAEGELLLADVGHYESEQFTKNLLADFLREKIPNFAISLSERNTNPVKYFI